MQSPFGADTVTVMVAVELPVLEVTPTSRTVGVGTVAVPLALRNVGGGVLTWSVSATEDWTVPDPAAGTITGETDTVVVHLDRSGLAAGTHTASLIVTSDGGGATVTLRVEVVDEPAYTYRIVASYPHDPAAFTQGLVIDGGDLFEGTGLTGHSTLRRVELTTGDVLQQVDLAPNYFGEGITVWQDRIVQLTWRNSTGFVYDRTPSNRSTPSPTPPRAGA